MTNQIDGKLTTCRHAQQSRDKSSATKTAAGNNTTEQAERQRQQVHPQLVVFVLGHRLSLSLPPPHSPSNTQYTERDTKAEPVTTKGNSRHDCGDNGDINNDEHGEDASLGRCRVGD